MKYFSLLKSQVYISLSFSTVIPVYTGVWTLSDTFLVCNYKILHDDWYSFNCIKLKSIIMQSHLQAFNTINIEFYKKL